MLSVKRNGIVVVTIAALLIGGVGCAHRRMQSRQPIESNLLEEPKAAPVVAEKSDLPPGIERMCWEEPKVVVEQKGPGLDSEGKWYHPSYDAVRLAKSGHWVPCDQLQK